MDTFSEKTCQGFTLVELLIAMALALVILTSLSSTFILQQKTYDVQQQIAEMNQNARAAMDIMSREIMLTGYGIVKNSSGNYDNLSWIDWVDDADGNDINFTSEPFFIQSGTGDSTESGGSDIIHIAGCFDGPAASLSSNASADTTTIDVTSGAEFNTDKKKLICINGIENTIVTEISGNTLTINPGLKNEYDTSVTTVPICVVKVISYSIVQETEDGEKVYTLKRNENLGAGRQPLAENIVELGISQSGTSIEINPLTAQTDKADPNYSENNGHRRRSFQTYLTPPNLTF